MTLLSSSSTVTLNNGVAMPILGLGVFLVSDEDAESAVSHALTHGYHHIDTAKVYGNEAGVGAGIRRSGVAREEVFLTTKLWNTDQGYDSAIAAIDASLGRLGLDYVDLYLIHWPMPAVGKQLESWHALEHILAQGKARAIGVCNNTPIHLQQLLDEADVVPAVNQIELHPHLPQYVTRAFDEYHGIVTEAWSPLGGTPRTGVNGGRRENVLLGDPVIAGVAAKHGVSPAQVLIRWHIQNGLVVIPKSVNPDRISQNANVFGFELDGADLVAIDALNDGVRASADPDEVNS